VRLPLFVILIERLDPAESVKGKRSKVSGSQGDLLVTDADVALVAVNILSIAAAILVLSFLCVQSRRNRRDSSVANAQEIGTSRVKVWMQEAKMQKRVRMRCERVRSLLHRRTKCTASLRGDRVCCF
jgi:hypothetical protein